MLENILETLDTTVAGCNLNKKVHHVSPKIIQ